MLGEREPLDDPAETHGICLWHAGKIVEQLPSTSFPGIRLLIVVRRTELQLYDHLVRSLVDLPGIAVILDRRERERRRAPRDVAIERRQVNRRIRRTWFSSLGYLVMRFGPEHGGSFSDEPTAAVPGAPPRLSG